MTNSFVNPSPTRLTDADFVSVATSIGLDAIHLKTLAAVESKGAGYLPDGRSKILFEAKWFHNLTKGRFDKSHPDISSPTWNKSLYKGGPAEYGRLERALALDPNAALQSASYGVFQIMGFNFKIVRRQRP